MLNVFADKTFEVKQYELQTIDGLDKKVEIGNIKYPCRVSDVSAKDLQVLNGIADSTNNLYKLHTNDTIQVELGDTIYILGTKYKVIKKYVPTHLNGQISHTKLYIQKIND